MEDCSLIYSTPIPSGAGKRKPKKRARKPKYRDMVLRAVKALREPNGCSYNAVAKYIEERYKVRNDFILKNVIVWLVSKRVLAKKGARIKLTGKALKLGTTGGNKQRRKSVSSKKKKAPKRKPKRRRR